MGYFDKVYKHFQEYFSGKRIGSVDTDEINRFFSWMVNSMENGKYKYSQVTLDRLARPSHKKCRMERRRSESKRAESIWALIEDFLW